MAIGYNGSVSWGIVPLNWSTSNLAGAFWDKTDNYLKSANDPLRYQIQWFYGNGLTEVVEPSALNWTGATPASGTGSGDIVNVIFKVYATTDRTLTFPNDWDLIGTIRKSRDIVNKKYDDSTPPNGHRFTVDISQLVSNELSYSLCPINKGTWQSPYYGGMNGGLTMQDNVLNGSSAMGNPISNYNVSKNGTFRHLKVEASFEVVNGDGELKEVAAISEKPPTIAVINSVNQFERDSLYYDKYTVDYYTAYRFLTRCPNFSGGSITQDFKKPVRIGEQAEWLQFYIRRNWSNEIRGVGLDSVVGATAIKIITTESDGSNNTFYLRDFEDNILTHPQGVYTIQSEYQNQVFIQNISPSYIINSGNVRSKNNSRTTYPYWSAYTSNTITSNTVSYTAELVKIGMWSPYAERVVSLKYKYTIDREDEKKPYDFVRFHWLNSLGGIDSYTAKRDVVEGLTISRDVIERKSGDRTWYQDNKGGNGTGGYTSVNGYHSDTMRGGDIYKGGREVININAERVQSVYTEPLNKSVAKWLEEIMLSPNVWIEMDTEATEMGNSINSYLRPSTKEYIPVIITSSDVETVNQAEGLVKFNIEYTLAHKVITQRN
jgi:hypothetical protein